MKSDEQEEKSSFCTITRVALSTLIVATCALAITTGIYVHKVNSYSDSEEPTLKTTTQSTATPKPYPSPEPGTSYNSYSGEYRYAAVAADNGPCSTLGTDMMAKGASTVDAALAVLLCQGATQFHSSGIGGGHFMTIYKRSNKTAYAVVSREQAIGTAHQNMYVNNTSAATKGGLAVAIPNELRGIKLAYDNFGGSVPWKDLFITTIDICKNGFLVSKSLASAIQSQWDELTNDFKEILSDDEGNPLKAGDTMKRTRLAETLEVISNEGIDAFYDGSLSDSIIKEIIENGGEMTREDLKNSTSVLKQAVKTTLLNGGYTLFGPPPPSSAVVVQFGLNILDGYQMTETDVSNEPDTILANHRYVEAFKFGFGKRSNLGDENFVDVTELVANMTNNEIGNSYRIKIRDDKTMPLSYYEPDFQLEEDHGTSHLSVVGPDGDAVTITTTINLTFGSKVWGNVTGIVYNNEMDDFSTPGMTNAFGVYPSPSNFIEPGKRPMSSMSPTIVVDKDGDVVMLAGASGGTRIISATAQTLVRSLWWGSTLKEAVDFQRFHDQLLPNYTYYENDMPQYLIDGMRSKGHDMETRSTGVVQAIRVDCEIGCVNCGRLCISAVSDGRKGGYPDGY